MLTLITREFSEQNIIFIQRKPVLSYEFASALFIICRSTGSKQKRSRWTRGCTHIIKTLWKTFLEWGSLTLRLGCNKFLPSRPSISKLRAYANRRLTFLNDIKFVDQRVFRLKCCEVLSQVGNLGKRGEKPTTGAERGNEPLLHFCR